jgi:hypothetical protein
MSLAVPSSAVFTPAQTGLVFLSKDNWERYYKFINQLKVFHIKKILHNSINVNIFKIMLADQVLSKTMNCQGIDFEVKLVNPQALRGDRFR